ncbi:hypothetical protein [Rhodanobacter soli]|uniref:Phage protein D n=1 Tax=Rhodanobacter soli TaxID=590609 RepID=A0ABV2Q008_9GAMM
MIDALLSGRLAADPKEGAASNATDAAVPGVVLTRAAGDQHRYHAADRQAYSGVRAQYDDQAKATTETVLVGTDDGHGLKTLRTTYSNRANALRAANTSACSAAP